MTTPERDYGLRRLRTLRLSIHRSEPRWRGWIDRGPGFVGARWAWFYAAAEFDAPPFNLDDLGHATPLTDDEWRSFADAIGIDAGPDNGSSEARQ